MNEYAKQHKNAWEFDAYNFWVEHAGKPEERAKEDTANPRAMLRRYADYFDRFEGVKVANICGSCGKKAIPLALLGADVTIFDISEANQRYALETAQAAHVRVDPPDLRRGGIDLCLPLFVQRRIGRSALSQPLPRLCKQFSVQRHRQPSFCPLML